MKCPYCLLGTDDTKLDKHAAHLWAKHADKIREHFTESADWEEVTRAIINGRIVQAVAMKFPDMPIYYKCIGCSHASWKVRTGHKHQSACLSGRSILEELLMSKTGTTVEPVSAIQPQINAIQETLKQLREQLDIVRQQNEETRRSFFTRSTMNFDAPGGMPGMPTAMPGDGTPSEVTHTRSSIPPSSDKAKGHSGMIPKGTTVHDDTPSIIDEIESIEDIDDTCSAPTPTPASAPKPGPKSKSMTSGVPPRNVTKKSSAGQTTVKP